MAPPLSAAKFLAALTGEGVSVVEVGSWTSHNRNSRGAWGPVHGVMIHHTVTRGTASSVALCRTGYAGLPGPLCHGVVDKDGRIHLVGYGRANHAGLGDDDVLAAVIAESALPKVNEANTDGNARFYGFECVNMGDNADPWPEAQIEAVARAAAGICREHGWGPESVIGHSEWQPGKVDPRGPIGKKGGPALTMAKIRARVGELLGAKPSKPSTPKPKPKPYTPPKFPAGLAPNRSKPSARSLQRVLKTCGFMPRSVPEDDNYGPQTQAAVNRFHAAHPSYRAAGKSYDPAIGPKGWAHLHRTAHAK
ncbi:N-acetylmuramoyl-L-alanine amidase [Streptomyces albidoflavus]|uniref:N-acetylmuramoyl-L-alanine amidase n=1 Tax=Streptomyces albidoflavus TaxID=1886 RepID=UPI00101E35B7|nr:N-acetylmuramoyl-L-alanine amidase [Streptomyces albidoflavus]RZD85290.1 N-acetylmuramoyl-L-alanine amidase [Streptomyces albidoflavus]RZE01600.1 N-acetylmuramoyl-L-alanine amidase [Streptomyces albidoflavus]